MNLKNFFKIVSLSFYSPDLYISVIQKWQHWGLGFLLRFSILITFIASVILFALVFTVDFNSGSARSLINKIPELKITDGKAAFVDSEFVSPIHIRYPNSDQAVIILDLDSKSEAKYKQDVFVLFGSEMITLNVLEGSPVTLSYKDLLEGSDSNVVNADFLIEFLNNQQQNILGVIFFLGVPLGSLVYFVLTIFKVMFYASVASIAATLFKMNLSFKQLCRVAIISNAPAVFISSILTAVFFNSALSEVSQSIASSIHLFYFIGAVAIYLKTRRDNIRKI